MDKTLERLSDQQADPGAASGQTTLPLPPLQSAIVQASIDFCSISPASHKIHNLQRLMDNWFYLYQQLEETDAGPDHHIQYTREYLATMVHDTHLVIEYIVNVDELVRRMQCPD